MFGNGVVVVVLDWWEFEGWGASGTGRDGGKGLKSCRVGWEGALLTKGGLVEDVPLGEDESVLLAGLVVAGWGGDGRVERRGDAWSGYADLGRRTLPTELTVFFVFSFRGGFFVGTLPFHVSHTDTVS